MTLSANQQAGPELAFNSPLSSNAPQWVFYYLRFATGGFPGGAVLENLPANEGDTSSSPGLGRSHMPRSN